MRLFICGDSTAAEYAPEDAPLTGWGQALGEYLPGVEIVNRAMAGRSTKSFLAEGRLQRIETEIRPGDALLVQFGHNDASALVWRHTAAWTSFVNNLSVFIDTARQNGALPILATPICVRLWRDGALQPSHGEYREAVRLLALRRGVPLLDLYRLSFEHVSSLGEEGSRALYMHLGKGAYPRYPDGLADDTHTQRAGARAFAALAADPLRDLLQAFERNGGEKICGS